MILKSHFQNQDRNNSGKRPLLFRPDVCITCDKVISKIFDIKTDLGYKRKEIQDQVKTYDILIDKIRGKKCTLNIDKIKQEFEISQALKVVIVVISGASNSGNIDETVEITSNTNNIQMLVLTKNQHINYYGHDSKIEINKVDFEKLDKIILG